jgi:hypothetical protein
VVSVNARDGVQMDGAQRASVELVLNACLRREAFRCRRAPGRGQTGGREGGREGGTEGGRLGG